MPLINRNAQRQGQGSFGGSGIPPNPNVWGASGNGLSTPTTPPPMSPGNGLFSGMLNQGVGGVGGVGPIAPMPQSTPATTVSRLTQQKKMQKPQGEMVGPPPTMGFGGLGMY